MPIPPERPKRIRINPIPPASQIDQYGGRHRPGTRIIKHMRTGEDAQEEWEKDHGPLDRPTYLRNKEREDEEKKKGQE